MAEGIAGAVLFAAQGRVDERLQRGIDAVGQGEAGREQEGGAGEGGSTGDEHTGASGR